MPNTLYWVSNTGVFNNSAGWSATSRGGGGASAPANDDTLIFDYGGVAVTSGHTATGLTGLNVIVRGGKDGYFGSIGTPASPLGASFASVDFNGNADMYLSGAISGRATVSASRVARTVPAVVLGGSGVTIASLVCAAGAVRIPTGTILTLAEIAGHPEVSKLLVEAGVTFTALTAMGGYTDSEVTPLTCKIAAAAIAMLKGSANFTAYEQWGGKAKLMGAANAPTWALYGGEFDLADNPYSITVGATAGVHAEGARIVQPQHATLTLHANTRKIGRGASFVNPPSGQSGGLSARLGDGSGLETA